ncbi:MAG: TolC family protein [Myxococcota bacterium]
MRCFCKRRLLLGFALTSLVVWAPIAANAANMSAATAAAPSSSSAVPTATATANTAAASPSRQGSYVLNMCQQVPELSLSQVVQQALRQDASVQLSREQLKQSSAQYWINWSALLPKLSMTAQHTSNVPRSSNDQLGAANQQAQAELYEQVARLSEQAGDARAAETLTRAAAALRNAPTTSFATIPDQQVDTGFIVSVPLFSPVALAQLRSGKLNMRSAQNRLRHTQSTTLLNAVQGFYTVATQQQQLLQAEAFLVTAQQHQTFVAERVRRGLRRAVDLTRVQLQLQQALQGVKQAQLNHQLAVGALGVLLGQECFFRVRQPDLPLLQPDQTPTVEQVVQRSLQSRSDLQAKYMSVKSIRSLYQGAGLAFLPMVEFASQTRYRQTDPTFPTDSWATALSIRGTWSLFEGGRRWAQWKQASALLRSERIAAHLLQRQVQAEAAAAVHELQNKRQQLQTLKTSLQLTKQLQEDTQILYRQGSDTVTSTDMIDANYKVFAAHIQLSSMQAQLQVAWAKLLHVQGLLKPVVLGK